MSFHGRTFGAPPRRASPGSAKVSALCPGTLQVPWNDTAAPGNRERQDLRDYARISAAEGGVMTPGSPEMAKTVKCAPQETGCFCHRRRGSGGPRPSRHVPRLSRTGLDAGFRDARKGYRRRTPLGAVLMRQKVADILKPGDHGTTFGGNPVACAAALAVVKIVSGSAFLKAVADRSAEFLEGLKNLRLSTNSSPASAATDSSSALAIDKKDSGGLVCRLPARKDFLVHTAGGTFWRFLPPLRCPRRKCAKALALDKAFSTVK